MNIGDFFLIASGIYVGIIMAAMTLWVFIRYGHEPDSANFPSHNFFLAAFPMLIVLGTMLVYG